MGTADKDYFLDAEGQVTTDEETAATLLIRKGQDIPADVAAKYGDKLKKGTKASALAEADTEDTEGGEKASSPSANKKATPSKNKSGAK